MVNGGATTIATDAARDKAHNIKALMKVLRDKNSDPSKVAEIEVTLGYRAAAEAEKKAKQVGHQIPFPAVTMSHPC